VTEEKIKKVIELNEIAKERGQSLAQMALAWDLRGDITSVLIGASKPAQVEDNVKALENLEFTKEELDKIDQILK
jgi:L-glyceraldehyde 3-phosphate reductase